MAGGLHRPTDHPRTMLRRIAQALTNHPDPRIAEPASRAANIAVADWPDNATTWVHGVATGPAAEWLEAADWLVDMIPPVTHFLNTPPPSPPAATPAPAPASDQPAPARPVSGRPERPEGAVLVALAGHDHVIVEADAGAAVHGRVRDLVIGSTWDGSIPAWRVRVTPTAALALRKVLTGERVVLDEATKTALAHAASQPAPPDVDMVDGGKKVVVRVMPADKAKFLAATTGFRWDHTHAAYTGDAGHAPEAVRYADQNQMVVSAAARAHADKLTAPFDYDGTIDGLRGIPLTELRCIAQARTDKAGKLNQFGLSSVYDLLTHVPRRYIDRSNQAKIRDLVVGEDVAFVATVKSVEVKARQRPPLVRIALTDGTGQVSVTYFSAVWVAKRFHQGMKVVVHGRLDRWVPKNGGRPQLQMTNPTMDPLGDDTAMIIPVYPQSEKSSVSTWDVHRAAMEAVTRLGNLTDPVPAELTAEHGLLARQDAFLQIHRPDTVANATVGRNRLAYDELLRIQLALGMTRAMTDAQPGVAHVPTGELTTQLVAGLPFSPTGAQQRAFTAIEDDMRKDKPMSRLLQGDVGSGKTIVALRAILVAIESGMQAALMAPTEILATQLYSELAERALGIEHPDGRVIVVEFLSNKTRAAAKRKILAGLADGSVDVVVGTHALIGDDVAFANLGLTIIDEQHRFGVDQRAALSAKNPDARPDVLAMTATPIPRTAAMTMFGDLDVTVLDELPPGRTPIATSWIPEQPNLDVLGGHPWDLIREQVEQGRQAYVVTSLVEDNEKLDAASAETTAQALRDGALSGLRVGLVHGQQQREDREEQMRQFKEGELDVIVATTVIEVGVNVPNASVIVILNAPRFGIAQLHQLRGRVGRGQWASSCVLVGEASSVDAQTRMEALCESTDGFYLAEVDLALRGEGAILGIGGKQAGRTDLRVASLRDDKDLVPLARADAARILADDPRLNRRPVLRTEVQNALPPAVVEWLSKS